jgi:GNAT superfamily N-acetyltransferase
VSEIRVRQAQLADVFAITDCYCSNVDNGVFTRRNPDGTRTPVSYENLSLAERFMNGGPWMSVETCAVWVAHLLRYEDEIPVVVEVDGLVLGEAEASIGQEPAPYGKHINISSLTVHQDATRQGYGSALVQYIKQLAQVTKARYVTVPFATNANHFLNVHGFRPLVARRQVILSTKPGRVFYKAIDLENFDVRRVHGWGMPIGRYHNARHEWWRILPGFWNGVPELVEPKCHRLEIQITNQPGILLLEEDRYLKKRAHVYLWTENPISGHMISAIRDRSAQLGYSELSLFVDDQGLSVVEAEAIDVRDAEILLAWRVDGH